MSAPLSILRYSTEDLPADERYAAWYLRDWPRQRPIYRTQPTEPFNTTWDSTQLGSIIFAVATITAMRWERHIQDIRESDFDPIILNLMVRGEAQGQIDGLPFHETAGMGHFHDLSLPSLHMSTGSFTYSIIMPRPVAEAWFAPLHDLRALVLSVDQAALLIGFCEQVQKAMPTLNQAQAEPLGRTFLELVTTVLKAARPSTTPLISADEALRLRASEEIERRLVEGDVGVEALCKSLGVSRARLFAAFHVDGGVQAFVLTRRLDNAKAALADVYRRETIGTIAHRLGFSDAAHLSRTFRARYGMTPREYRQLVAANLQVMRTGSAPER
ncbi:helix-turn-helix domain-containing protein [Brevundimonas sp.]